MSIGIENADDNVIWNRPVNWIDKEYHYDRIETKGVCTMAIIDG